MNREGTRAILSSTGFGYGAMKFIRLPDGWTPHIGLHGVGRVLVREEPSEKAKAAAEQL